MRLIIGIFLVLILCEVSAQPNCEAYRIEGKLKRYEACIVSEKRAGHYQFSREYQQALDEALDIDSTFAYAYRAKSTAYLKSGDFLTWKALMDKAVHFDPAGNLDYRGWCRYQFFRDYKGAIEDIERLDSLVDYDIGHSVNADYHLHIARALCYKALGQKEKAIQIILDQLSNPDHFVGLYDYLHLGVLYLETGKYAEAVEALNAQIEQNDIAEAYFYLGLAYDHLGLPHMPNNLYKMAYDKYVSDARMNDPYTAQMDKVYLKDIEEKL